VASIAAVKIVIQEKHSAPFAGRENLLTNVIEFVGLITMAFGRSEQKEELCEVNQGVSWTRIRGGKKDLPRYDLAYWLGESDTW